MGSSKEPKHGNPTKQTILTSIIKQVWWPERSLLSPCLSVSPMLSSSGPRRLNAAETPSVSPSVGQSVSRQNSSSSARRRQATEELQIPRVCQLSHLGGLRGRILLQQLQLPSSKHQTLQRIDK